MTVIDALRGGLIVSCQAGAASPLSGPEAMARFAQAAVMAGAVGIRANGPDDVGAIVATTGVPVIALHKVQGPRRRMITPTRELARGLIEAGAAILAVEATAEADEYGADPFPLLVAEGVPVMADISTVDEGLAAWDAGAAVVGTTLSGYTPYSRSAETPDLELVESLAGRGIPVIAEGRYRSPAEVAAAFAAGAHAVVVGGAITDPLATAERFAAAAPRRRTP